MRLSRNQKRELVFKILMAFIFIYTILGIASSVAIVLNSLFFDLGIDEKWTRIGLWFGTSIWMIPTTLLLKDFKEFRGVKERLMSIVIVCVQVLLILGIYLPGLRNITICINVSTWCTTTIIFTGFFISQKFDKWRRDKQLHREGYKSIQ